MPTAVTNFVGCVSGIQIGDFTIVAMFSWWCLVACVLAKPAVAVVGGDPAAPPEPDAAVAFVQKHGFGARIEGLRDNRLGYYSFFGIRLICFLPTITWLSIALFL